MQQRNILSTDLNNEVLTQALESMPGGFFIYRADEDEEIIFANHYVLEIFDCDTHEQFMELTGGTFRSLIHPDDRDHVEKAIDMQIDTGLDMFDHVNYRIITRTGKVRYIEDFGRKVVLDGVGPVYYVFIVDSDIKYLTYDIDKLTGLPGQKRFLEYASHILKLNHLDPNAPEMVFLYFNISKFKMINVKYGVETGDRILRGAAGALKQMFPNNFISRFSDDHFCVLTENIDIEDKLFRLRRQLSTLEKDVPLNGRVGGYKVGNGQVDPAIACDFAKMACDSLRDSSEKSFTYYTEEVRRKLSSYEYVMDHVDMAIAEGYIKVYYQPVIRALSGNLCGLESLARWIDPNLGFLSPAEFIPALEDSHQIYKLDSYVIREVCRQLRERIDAKLPVVAISINLSRLDFILTDIARVIEDAVDQYQIPRELLNIEITESMFLEDAGRIHEESNRFHELGYQVWMDDFGSGYSSLNLLKDFEFDELKMDMLFLSSFTERSKDIMEATIAMAKKIHIQTLAEGVETKEQYEFLRFIGCEKIQGYYFGKPAPFEETMKHCQEQGIEVETRGWSNFYDKIGRHNFLSERPTAYFLDDGETSHFLIANEPYMESLKLSGMASKEITEMVLNSHDAALYHTFRDYTERLCKSGKEERLTYPVDGYLMSLTSRKIAEYQGLRCIEAHLSSFTDVQNQKEEDAFDKAILHLMFLYDMVVIMDLEEDTIKYLKINQTSPNSNETGIRKGIREQLMGYHDRTIFVGDSKEYLKFIDMDTMVDRLKKSSSGHIAEYFRTREEDGTFAWCVHDFMLIPNANSTQLLVSVKKAALDDVAVRKKIMDQYQEEFGVEKVEESEEQMFQKSMLFRNIEEFSSVKYFWKDMNRRFVGVSRSFLEYYGLESEDELIGKTDEEMNWHVADGPYRNDEEEVLTLGKHFEDVPGKCIIQGVLHNIVASKMPLYQDGKIVGLIGYFIDAERFQKRKQEIENNTMIDSVTKLASARLIMENFITYAAECRSLDHDFAGIYFTLDGYAPYRAAYGEEAANEMLKVAAEIIRKQFGQEASIGRLRDGNFIVFYHYRNKMEISIAVEKLEKRLKVIDLGDKTVTGFPKIQVSYASDFSEPESMMMALVTTTRKKYMEGGHA